MTVLEWGLRRPAPSRQARCESRAADALMTVSAASGREAVKCLRLPQCHGVSIWAERQRASVELLRDLVSLDGICDRREDFCGSPGEL